MSTSNSCIYSQAAQATITTKNYKKKYIFASIENQAGRRNAAQNNVYKK